MIGYSALSASNRNARTGVSSKRSALVIRVSVNDAERSITTEKNEVSDTENGPFAPREITPIRFVPPRVLVSLSLFSYLEAVQRDQGTRRRVNGEEKRRRATGRPGKIEETEGQMPHDG